MVICYPKTSFSELDRWVAELVKSFEALCENNESLDDFRYELNQAFSVEDAIVRLAVQHD
jgi:hypothetical protein